MQLSVEPAGFMPRWRAAAARLVVPGLFLACAWATYNVPVALRDGRIGRLDGVAVALQTSLEPAIASTLLVVAMAFVEAAKLRGRARVLAMVAAALVTAALSTMTGILFMTGTRMWPAPPWSSPVLMWSNFGLSAMICIGVLIVEDQRRRSALRSAALRDARLRAAEVVLRTAEVRLQAARARVEPRFLFDALSAAERIYHINAAAGNALLDNLVTYLRAVVPDLGEHPADPRREAEIAGLRLAIESAIAGVGPGPSTKTEHEEPEGDPR